MPLQEVAHRRKLHWFDHKYRRSDPLAHYVMHGMVKGVRERGKPKGTCGANTLQDGHGFMRTLMSKKCSNGQQGGMTWYNMHGDIFSVINAAVHIYHMYSILGGSFTSPCTEMGLA